MNTSPSTRRAIDSPRQGSHWSGTKLTQFVSRFWYTGYSALMNRGEAMGSASVTSEKSEGLIKSYFQPTVCLADWWLIKAGNELAVAGCSSRPKQGMRVFSSAPIRKRHDVLTLETSDGICVILNASMNRPRTMESGFPSEVCDHFIYGFPPYWKAYYEKFMCHESSPRDLLRFRPQKKQSPQSKEKDGLLYRHNHKSVLDMQDRLNADDLLKDEKDKPVAAPSPRTSVTVPTEDTSNLSSISSGVHEQESYPEVPTSEGKVRKCAIPTPNGQQKNGKRTSRVSGADLTVSHIKGEWTSSDRALDGTDLGSYEGSGFQSCTVRRKLIKSGEGPDQIIWTPIQNENKQRTEIDGDKHKGEHKASPNRAGAVAGKHKPAVTADRRSGQSENIEASGVRTRSKRYGTPETSRNNNLGFTRSKSGRLLVPTLDFWRNQRAIYDLDRTVTGIQDSIPLGNPRKGSQSAPPTKRRKM